MTSWPSSGWFRGLPLSDVPRAGDKRGFVAAPAMGVSIREFGGWGCAGSRVYRRRFGRFVGGGCSLDGCFGVGAFFDVVADSVARVGYSGGFGGRSGGCPPGYASVPDCSTGVGLDSFRVADVVRI